MQVTFATPNYNQYRLRNSSYNISQNNAAQNNPSFGAIPKINQTTLKSFFKSSKLKTFGMIFLLLGFKTYSCVSTPGKIQTALNVDCSQINAADISPLSKINFQSNLPQARELLTIGNAKCACEELKQNSAKSRIFAYGRTAQTLLSQIKQGTKALKSIAKR